MRLPKNSKKVFTGVLFDVYQWNQKMYDGSYKTFEKIIRKPSVDVIAIVNNKIIILIQKQPTRELFFSLPGGGVEKRQTPVQAAKEELLQETGYGAKEIKLVNEFFGDSKVFFHESLFIAKDCKKVAQQNLDSGEKIKIIFYSFDDFLQLSRNKYFIAPFELKFMMYEALIDPKKKEKLRKKIFES